jgi:hypothetical protein
MNRERAEIFLRLLVEAELRGPAVPARAGEWLPPRASPGAPFVSRSAALTRAAWALTAVGALDLDTAEDIMFEADLALAVRYRPGQAEAGAGGPPLAVPGGPSRFARAQLAVRPRGMAAAATSGTGGAGGTGGADVVAGDGQSVERYVPVGRMILFHDETVSGEVDLMSYAQTAAGARLVAAWQARDPLLPRRRGLPPVEAFIVTDDQGQRYKLEFATKGRSESSCDLILRPDPPPGIAWLDITAPGEQAVRIDLGRPAGVLAPRVSDVRLSAGEQLLNRIAERVLGFAPEFPAHQTAGLGIAIAALQAAEVLSPLSPVPGQLATLCATLQVRGHGITCAPAPELPEPWLSLLSHYHRRRPEGALARDGFAAAAAALPELDGIRLVLLGLHNCDGGTWVNALAHGDLVRRQYGPHGLDMTFPLSIWIRDDAGRWHLARPASWFDEGREANVMFRLTPPLTRSPAAIEVLAAGQSAQVRADVPLRWGYPP